MTCFQSGGDSFKTSFSISLAMVSSNLITFCWRISSGVNWGSVGPINTGSRGDFDWDFLLWCCFLSSWWGLISLLGGWEEGLSILGFLDGISAGGRSHLTSFVFLFQ